MRKIQALLGNNGGISEFQVLFDINSNFHRVILDFPTQTISNYLSMDIFTQIKRKLVIIDVKFFQ